MILNKNFLWFLRIFFFGFNFFYVVKNDVNLRELSEVKWGVIWKFFVAIFFFLSSFHI